jgi:hypothetical protein
MTKVSDAQPIVLSSAAKHDEGLATRPASPLLRTLAGNDRIPLIWRRSYFNVPWNPLALKVAVASGVVGTQEMSWPPLENGCQPQPLPQIRSW